MDPVAIGLAGQTEHKERTEFRERRVKGENKPRREQTEHDISRGTHHMINQSRPSPAFRTASNKSWAWRPGNEARLCHAAVNVDGQGAVATQVSSPDSCVA